MYEVNCDKEKLVGSFKAFCKQKKKNLGFFCLFHMLLASCLVLMVPVLSWSWSCAARLPDVICIGRGPR